jgi:hypothetical protein
VWQGFGVSVRRVRDRDEAGRARNARPRDAAGRPLPYGTPGVPQVPDDLDLTPEETVTEAQRLLDEGLPFQAHEVLEAAWKSAPEPERELWQGLAQLAVGFTHVRRGNAQGACSLLRRGAGRIAPYEHAPYAIAAVRLAEHAYALATRIERDGLTSVTDADLAPRLT